MGHTADFRMIGTVVKIDDFEKVTKLRLVVHSERKVGLARNAILKKTIESDHYFTLTIFDAAVRKFVNQHLAPRDHIQAKGEIRYSQRDLEGKLVDSHEFIAKKFEKEEDGAVIRSHR